MVILLVEDDPAQLEPLHAALSQAGHMEYLMRHPRQLLSRDRIELADGVMGGWGDR